MKRLYICDYPYVLFQAIIQTLEKQEDQNELLFCNSLENMFPLYQQIVNSGIFKKVYFFDDVYYKKEISKIFNYSMKQVNSSHLWIQLESLLKGFALILKSNQKIHKIPLPIDIEAAEYDEIYYCDRMSTLMFYLNKKKISYIAMQHAKNVWKIKMTSEIVKIKLFSLLEKLHISCGICCYTQACRAIQVTENKDIRHFPKDKRMIEWDIDQAVRGLSSDQKNHIFLIYAEAYGLKFDCNQVYNLVVTTPLFQDNYVPNENMQIKFYRDMMEKYFLEDVPIIIKPHPRETVDYASHFPGCIVLDNNISAEVLNFSKDLKFNTVFTLFSTSIHSFEEKAKNVVVLEPHAKNRQSIESLQNYKSKLVI